MCIIQNIARVPGYSAIAIGLQHSFAARTKCSNISLWISGVLFYFELCEIAIHSPPDACYAFRARHDYRWNKAIFYDRGIGTRWTRSQRERTSVDGRFGVRYSPWRFAQNRCAVFSNNININIIAESIQVDIFESKTFQSNATASRPMEQSPSPLAPFALRSRSKCFEWFS